MKPRNEFLLRVKKWMFWIIFMFVIFIHFPVMVVLAISPHPTIMKCLKLHGIAILLFVFILSFIAGGVKLFYMSDKAGIELRKINERKTEPVKK